MATTAATLRRTNENPGTRAKLSGLNTSAFKVREVLDLIRGENVGRANEILTFCERGPAVPVQKLLNSAIANAVQNDELSADELFVTSCFADEGPTMKRIKFMGHGRTGRIRKRTSSVTIVVARLPQDQIERMRVQETKAAPSSRRRRVSTSRAERVSRSQEVKEAVEEETPLVDETIEEAPAVAEVEETTDPKAEAELEAETEELEAEAEVTDKEEK